MKLRIRIAMTVLSLAGGLAASTMSAAPATAGVVSLPPVVHRPAPALRHFLPVLPTAHASCTSAHPVGSTRVTAKVCTALEPGRFLTVSTRVILGNPSRMARTADIALKTTAVINGRPVTRAQTFVVTVPGGGTAERAVTLTPGNLKGSVSGAATVTVRGLASTTVKISSPTLKF